MSNRMPNRYQLASTRVAHICRHLVCDSFQALRYTPIPSNIHLFIRFLFRYGFFSIGQITRVQRDQKNEKCEYVPSMKTVSV
jgi:hypothetical protein